jgi:hypothetical protein
MPSVAFNRRPYRAFLSHSHVDKSFVDKLYVWLSEFAGMKVWYDSVEFPNGLVASELGNALERCKSAILILSEKSVSSGWVEEEWNISVEQKNFTPDFQIIALKLDKCTLPAALRARKWIEVQEGELSASVACQVLEGLHWYSTQPSEVSRPAFYLSRGNQTAEQLLSRCRSAGYRFVRDSPDQEHFSETRIKNLIASTSGVCAFVSNRGAGATSKYILEEIRYAQEMNVPVLAILDPGVARTSIDEILPKKHSVIEKAELDSEQVESLAEDFLDRAPRPLRGAHCFLGHAFTQDQRPAWQMAKRIAEVVSGLPCVSGDDLTGDSAQQQIVEKIASSAISIFDISEERLNSCIEAGVARGAGVRYELVCKGPRHRPPFLFRDKQVFFYETTTDLLGLVRKLMFDFRRVVS